jgi:tetratricopeptide (TPR) repeat protein
MSDMPIQQDNAGAVDFFISRAGAQANIAKKIGSFLEQAGHSTILQDWDFHDKNIIERMHDALKRSAHVILLLSPEYLASSYCTAEWANAMMGDPLNKQGRVIFLRVAECSPDGMLKGMAYLDLVSLLKDGDEAALRDIILAAIRPDRPRTGPLERFWRTPKPLLHAKLHQPPPNFTGRRSDLDALHRVLTPPVQDGDPGMPARAAIHGLAGTGKSVLAMQYAWEHQCEFAGAWWILAATVDEISRSLVSLGSLFLPGLQDMQDRDRAVAATLDLIRSGGFAKPWLLIFDDVETPQALRAFLPAGGAVVIITSRWSDWSGEATSFFLGVLPPPEAISFLLQRTGREDRAGAERLAGTLGFLPLALAHAGAYCKHTGESLVSYAQRLPDLIDRAPAGTDYERTVFATFTSACEAASALCKDSSTVVAFAAFLSPDDIPVYLIDDDIMPRIARDAALEALAILSLIIVREKPNGNAVIDLHRLVQEVARIQIAMRDKNDNELNRVFNALAKYLPGEIWETEEAASSVFAAGDLVLRTHFDPARKSVEVFPPDDKHEKYYLTFWRARWAEATGQEKNKYDRLMGKIFAYGAVAEEYGVPIDPKHARDWRRWDELLPHAATLAAHIKECLGEGKYTSRLSGALAAILYSQGRSHDLVERLLRSAIADVEAAPASDRPLLTQSLRNLSYFLSEFKRRDEAEAPLKKALVIDAEEFGLEHPSTVRDALRLAALLVELKRIDEARAIFKDVSDTIKTVFGDSKTWPRDVERAFGSILFLEFSEALFKEAEERKLQHDVRMELRRLKSATVRQWRLGVALYVVGAILAVFAASSILESHLKLIFPMRELVALYRIGLHGPATWGIELINSTIVIPTWVWDILAFWCSFWLAVNASLYHLEGRSILGMMNSMAISYGVPRARRYMLNAGGSLAMFLLGPLVFVGFNIRKRRFKDPDSKGLLIFLSSVLICILGIVFLSLAFV